MVTSEPSAYALEQYWHFINERHRIYLKREAGEPKPWSKEEAFQNYKFCNVFRILDKTSQDLLRVIEPHLDDDPSTILFNIFVFRAFNLTSTYKLLGWQDRWSLKSVTDDLRELVNSGKTLISGAYMIRGYLDQPKWQSIPNSLDKIWSTKRSLYLEIAHERTLQNCYRAILDRGYWGWGPFTSYQIALDLSYTSILSNPKDVDTWCYFGPGASRGIQAIYPGIRRSDYLSASIELLQMSPDYLEPHVPTLTLQDVEFALCELSKYLRIKEGGRGKHKYNGRQ